MIDHLGKPPIASREAEPWSSLLARRLSQSEPALFGLLLLPALDRLRELLVLLRHLREAVLPELLRPGPVPLRRLLARLLDPQTIEQREMTMSELEYSAKLQSLNRADLLKLCRAFRVPFWCSEYRFLLLNDLGYLVWCMAVAKKRGRRAAPCEGYDEPEILPSSTHPICLMSADGGHAGSHRCGCCR
jgi:hypothetical protein